MVGVCTACRAVCAVLTYLDQTIRQHQAAWQLDGLAQWRRHVVCRLELTEMIKRRVCHQRWYMQVYMYIYSKTCKHGICQSLLATTNAIRCNWRIQRTLNSFASPYSREFSALLFAQVENDVRRSLSISASLGSVPHPQLLDMIGCWLLTRGYCSLAAPGESATLLSFAEVHCGAYTTSEESIPPNKHIIMQD